MSACVVMSRHNYRSGQGMESHTLVITSAVPPRPSQPSNKHADVVLEREVALKAAGRRVLSGTSRSAAASAPAHGSGGQLTCIHHRESLLDSHRGVYHNCRYRRRSAGTSNKGASKPWCRRFKRLRSTILTAVTRRELCVSALTARTTKSTSTRSTHRSSDPHSASTSPTPARWAAAPGALAAPGPAPRRRTPRR